MLFTLRVLILFVLAACVPCATAYAQAKTELGAGGVVSIQPEGQDDGHYLSGTLGGAAPAVVVSAGVRASGFIVRGEVSAGMSIGSADQHQLVPGGQLYWTGQHRDTVVSGLVGYHAGATAVQVEILGGLSWVRGDTARKEVVFRPFFPTTPQPQRDETITNTWRAWSGGADIVIPVTARLAIVPTGRVHYVVHREPIDQPPQLGVGAWIVRVGAGVRVSF